jgi:hypothetical protein
MELTQAEEAGDWDSMFFSRRTTEKISQGIHLRDKVTLSTRKLKHKSAPDSLGAIQAANISQCYRTFTSQLESVICLSGPADC